MNDNATDTRPLTEVAVGILIRPDGQVLLAQRPTGKPYAGWWEFPGGKFEPGELAHEAIVRELHEELGLRVISSRAWLVREHAYEHARVRLHFRLVEQWSGEPESREDQAFGWCDPANAGVSPLLPATVPLMRLLALPTLYAISAGHLLGTDVFLARLDQALGEGLKGLQLREPGLADAAFEHLFAEVLRRCRRHHAMLLVNSQHPARFWAEADGVHLRAADFTAPDFTFPLPRDELAWVAASCHDERELSLAGVLGVDFAVLGPVGPTQSHPGAAGIGWSGFSDIAALTPVPVYALGVAMIEGAFGRR